MDSFVTHPYIVVIAPYWKARLSSGVYVAGLMRVAFQVRWIHYKAETSHPKDEVKSPPLLQEHDYVLIYNSLPWRVQ
jgi:hypothetical protein